MKRRTALKAMLAGLIATSSILVNPFSTKAQDQVNIDWLTEPQTGQVRKNIHFLMDRSSSMTAEQLSAAMDAFVMVATQSIDEINIAVTVFANGAARWPGIKTEKLPSGWAELPSPDAVNAAKIFVICSTVPSNSTSLADAINSVDENVRDLTIVVISDLVFNEMLEEAVAVVRTKLDSIEKGSGERPSIGFIGSGVTDDSERRGKLLTMETSVAGWIGIVR